MTWIVRFILGGIIYMGIEVLYDNTSDRCMGFIGGLAFVISSILLMFNLPYLINCLLIGVIVTVLELIGGLVFNRKYHIWDYRKLPFNILGHVCLLFTVIWIVVIAPIIIWFDQILINSGL